MKLGKIALVTNNPQLARFFEMEFFALPYELNVLHTFSKLGDSYDCIIADNDTVDPVGAFSCPVINVSSRFDAVDIFPHSRTCTLPWPTPISAIGELLWVATLDGFDEHTNKKKIRSQYNTVYVTDLNTNSVMIENITLKLTSNELAVLDALCSARGEVVDRKYLSELLGASDGNIADVYICRLRKKLEGRLNRKLIFAERGRGYRTILTIKK